MKPIFFPILACVTAALTLGGCATKRSIFDARPVEEVQYLQATLGATSFKPCESINSTINLPVPVQNARVIWNQGSPVLIYEGAFREAIKTVWQPLTSKFQQDGEGVVVGQRGMPYVGDFFASTDAIGGFWTSYRFKIPNTEMHAVAVEYLAKSSGSKTNIVRLAMPQKRDHTALRSWLIPLPQAGTAANIQAQQTGLAHVIVRTVSTLPGTIEGSETTYTWYILNAPKGVVKKMGEFKPNGSFVNIEKFLLSRDFSDPVGIGISTNSTSAAGHFDTKSRGTTTILAIRPFASGTPTHVLHEDDRPLSSLVVSETNFFLESAMVAWVRDPIDTPHPSIEWITTPIKVPGTPGSDPLGARKGRRLVRNTALKRITLGYFPSQLEFAQVPGEGGSAATALTWWGGTDSERGLVLTRMSPSGKIDAQNRGSPTITHAFVSRDNLGSPFDATFSTSLEPALIMVYADTPKNQNTANPSKIRFCTATKSQLMD